MPLQRGTGFPSVVVISNGGRKYVGPRVEEKAFKQSRRKSREIHNGRTH